MPRRIFVTDQPYPTTDDVRAQAAAAGATEIVHGIGPGLEALGVTTFGAHELADPPPPDPPPATDSEKLAAARDALSVLDVIEAPVTAADLADVLVDVKIALEG
jgi:hypothetical protein